MSSGLDKRATLTAQVLADQQALADRTRSLDPSFPFAIFSFPVDFFGIVPEPLPLPSAP
jgi:hypothetical protein